MGSQLTEKERVEFKRLTGREREPGKLVKEFVCRQWCGRKPLLPVVRDAGALSRFDRDDHGTIVTPGSMVQNLDDREWRR